MVASRPPPGGGLRSAECLSRFVTSTFLIQITSLMSANKYTIKERCPFSFQSLSNKSIKSIANYRNRSKSIVTKTRVIDLSIYDINRLISMDYDRLRSISIEYRKYRYVLLQGNAGPWPWCTDRAIARSIHQGRGLRFPCNDLTTVRVRYKSLFIS